MGEVHQHGTAARAALAHALAGLAEAALEIGGDGHLQLTEAQLRQRWDQLLTRMRMKLREAGLRSDLIRSARPGLVELVLGPGDKVVDGT